jgi:YceI-like domain
MKTKFKSRSLFVATVAAFTFGCGDQSSKSAAANSAPGGNTVLLAQATAPAASAPTTGSLTRLDARSGSKMRIEGTSTVHDWQAESPLILGYIEVGPNFPLEPGQNATPGKVEVKGEATTTVNSLRSIEKDGKAYSDTMDQKMHDMMSYTTHPKIIYRPKELVLKEVPKDKNEPYVFDSRGELEIAGVTNTISMPIKVTPMAGGRVKISGTIGLKMTDYKIEPASIVFAKTGNDVKVIFEWVLGQKKPAAAAK